MKSKLVLVGMTSALLLVSACGKKQQLAAKGPLEKNPPKIQKAKDEPGATKKVIAFLELPPIINAQMVDSGLDMGKNCAQQVEITDPKGVVTRAVEFHNVTCPQSSRPKPEAGVVALDESTLAFSLGISDKSVSSGSGEREYYLWYDEYRTFGEFYANGAFFGGPGSPTVRLFELCEYTNRSGEGVTSTYGGNCKVIEGSNQQFLSVEALN